uniref:Somatostatin/Cortistatin C-terminal domain-containing protein n=1 Tax=Pelusios castaneus TaxID=367368 RepID=A0A8C8S1R2_9SAUR
MKDSVSLLNSRVCTKNNWEIMILHTYLQELTDVKESTVLTFLSALADWTSQMDNASWMEEEIELDNQQEKAAFPQPQAQEKSPCRNFFWKTFSSC